MPTVEQVLLTTVGLVGLPPLTVALVACAVVAMALPALAARGFRRHFRTSDLELAPPSAASGWSGGPGSHVAWTDLGREGRRLLARAPGAPGALRLYVGLESAPTPAARVGLLIAEAERTIALTRGTVVVAVPTGSGWVNPVALEAVERATGGDVATLVLPYAAEPSWLSVAAHPGAHVRSAEALLRALAAHLGAVPPAQRPRLVVLGESLGANGLRAALERVPHVADDVAGGLLVGGIGSAHWAPPGRVRLVRHDDDPVVRLSLRDGVRALARTVRALPGAGSAPEGRGHHCGRELDVAWRAALPRAASARRPSALRDPSPTRLSRVG